MIFTTFLKCLSNMFSSLTTKDNKINVSVTNPFDYVSRIY